MKPWDLRYLFEEVGSAAQQRVFKIKLTMEQLTQFSEKCPWQKISSERTVHLLYCTRSYTQHVASTIHIGTCLLLHIPDITGKIYLRKVSTQFNRLLIDTGGHLLCMDHKSHKSTQRKVQVLVYSREELSVTMWGALCFALCMHFLRSMIYCLWLHALHFIMLLQLTFPSQHNTLD